MIKIDYSRVQEKFEELNRLKEEYKKVADDKTVALKAVVDNHNAELEKVFNYQRKVVEYFEALERLTATKTEIAKQLKAVNASIKSAGIVDQDQIEKLRKDATAKLDALIPTIESQVTQYDLELVELSKLAYAAMAPYLDQTAKEFAIKYNECIRSGKNWADTDESRRAIILVEISKLRATHRLWPEALSYSKQRDKAMEYLREIKKCIEDISYQDLKKYRDAWYTEAADHTDVKAAIKLLEAMVRTKQQTQALQYSEALLPEEERGNLELDTVDQVLDIQLSN